MHWLGDILKRNNHLIDSYYIQLDTQGCFVKKGDAKDVGNFGYGFHMSYLRLCGDQF